MLLAGVLTGLAILGRANAIILLAPLAFAVWKRPRGFGPPVALVLAAVLTVAPWTIRNYRVLDAFVPVSTQLGSALAGTYNSEAMADKQNPASWRTLKRVDDYRPIFNRVRSIPEPQLERELRDASLEFIKAHPGYVLTVGYWTTRRMLDLAGLDWSIHTAATISATRKPAIAGVLCFWVFAVLAVIGAFTQRARAAPLWLWSIPLLMYLSVVFLVVETPRYRTRDRSVHRAAGGARGHAGCASGTAAATKRRADGREERARRRQVSAQLLEREPDLVGAVVAGLRERGPGEVGRARLGPVAEVRRQALPAVAPVGLLHAGGAGDPERVQRGLERLPDQDRGGVRPGAGGRRVELVELALGLVEHGGDVHAISAWMKSRVLSGSRLSVDGSSSAPCEPRLSSATSAAVGPP